MWTQEPKNLSLTFTLQIVVQFPTWRNLSDVQISMFQRHVSPAAKCVQMYIQEQLASNWFQFAKNRKCCKPADEQKLVDMTRQFLNG